MSLCQTLAIAAVIVGGLSQINLAVGSESQPRGIDEMIVALGGDDFLAREDATVGLVAAGPEALAPLRELITQTDPEITWRARRVLIEIASNSEEAVANQAISALNEYASAGHTSFNGLEAQVRWWRNVKTMPHAQQVQELNKWLWAKNGGVDPFFVRALRGC